MKGAGRRALSLSVLLGLLLEGLLAQQFRSQHYSVEQGLSQSTVRCILQDRRGFIWFGTADGLNRFDGYAFKVFHHNPHTPNGLGGDDVSALAEDSSGTLWIGTNEGLCRYDPIAGTFHRYGAESSSSEFPHSGRVLSLFVSREGDLWVGGRSSLVRISMHGGETRIFPQPIKPLFQDDGGNLWAARRDSLFQYDNRTNSFRHVPIPRGLNRSLILTGYRDRSGILWFGTGGSGLLEFEPASGRWMAHRLRSARSPGVFQDQISSVLEDREGRLWVGTRDAGLTLFDRREQAFQRISLPADARGGSRFASVWALSLDRSGVLWAGYDGAGIIRIVTSPDKFAHILLPPLGGSETGDNFLKPIMVDRAGAIWLGTFDKGLRVLDRERGTLRRYTPSRKDPRSLSGTSVTMIFEDRGGRVWVGTQNGLDSYSNGEFRHHALPGSPAGNPLSDFVTSCCEDSAGTLWIGTRAGLLKMGPSRAAVEPAGSPGDTALARLRLAYIETLCAGSDGTLWIGTHGEGLLRFRPGTGSLARFSSSVEPSTISNDVVKTIHLRADGILWIGTESGLNRLDPRRGEWRRFSVTEGLANDFIYGVLEDGRGNIWMSTNRGISKMSDPDSATPLFRNYTIDDGLQSFEFNTGSYARGRSGELLFGGVNGFNIFHPDSLRDNPFIPPVVLTGFKKFDQQFDPGGDIASLPSVAIGPSESVFSFEFAALEFTHPALNRYAYRMVGFDKEWVASGGRREARFTNLDPGTYTFQVRGSNNDGVWNEQGASIEVVVIPPFWRRPWFLGLTATGATLLLAGGVRYVSTRKLRKTIQRMEQERAIQIERQKTRERIARDLHDDLASTVGSAGLFLESAKTRLPDLPSTTKDLLDRTGRLLSEAEEAMSDIVWSVSPAHDSLESLLVRIRLTTAELAAPQGMAHEVIFPGDLSEFTLSPELRRSVYLVFKEAISNAVRHSHASRVRVEARVEGDRLVLSVEDNGRGMASTGETPMPTKRGHGIRNMKKRAEESGAGLEILSEYGKGTTVRLSAGMTRVSH